MDLGKDPFYVDMTEVIKRGTAEVLAQKEDGLLLYESVSKAYMMTAKSEETAKAFIPLLKKPELLAVHEEFYIEELQRRFGVKKQMTCYQAAYQKGVPLPMPKTRLKIRPLAMEHCDVVREAYSHSIGENYIAGRIQAGELYGGFHEGQLVGFGGYHEEGSIGMLEVLPKFKGNGFGAALVVYLVNETLAKGRIPFSQMTVDNHISIRLHQKLGFDITDSPLYWLD